MKYTPLHCECEACQSGATCLAPKATSYTVEVLSVRVNLYHILERAVEEGILRGYHRAHKHTDAPGELTIQEEIRQAIMGNLCEVLVFDDP